MEATADRSIGPRQALIGYTWWKQRFGGDAGVVGRQIQVGDEAFRDGERDAAGIRIPADGVGGSTVPVIWMSLNLSAEQERARNLHSLEQWSHD